MVQPTQIIAAHKQHGQAHRGHEVEHVLTLVERHPQTASALEQQHISGAGAAVANDVTSQSCAAQVCAFASCSQMRRCGQAEAMQGRCRQHGGALRHALNGGGIHAGIGQRGRIGLLRRNTCLHRLYSLGVDPGQQQGPQQGRRHHGLAHICAGASYKKAP